MSDKKFFLDQLESQPHALVFGGQSTPWTSALADQCTQPDVKEQLEGYVKASERLLAAVSTDLLADLGRPLDLFGYSSSSSKLGSAANAFASVPGIALTQLGALIDLQSLGYSLTKAKPLAVLGHSQGVIAEHMVKAMQAASEQSDLDQPLEAAAAGINQILAIARLIGAAASRQGRILDLYSNEHVSPMLSVKGATFRQINALVDRIDRTSGPISIAVINSQSHYVLSGYPEDLAAFALEAGKENRHQVKLRQEKQRGGTPFNPILEYLDVTIPFHSPLMEPAVEQTVRWSKTCGLDVELTQILAKEVLVNQVDWSHKVRQLVEASNPTKLWIIDMGPGATVGKLISNVVQGTGVGLVEATSQSERAGLSTLETEPERTENWKEFAPGIIKTPAGEKVSTKFSRLTGKPPVLLAGMTPTTVDPEIVAAAANDGYWAELAGGGQVTAEVFDAHIALLQEELKEGHSVEFNAMFMDRYLWNLQFGGSRIVPKKRESGTPIDGVVVSAGIPELDEAKKLISSLNAEGFPYVAFKPGTIDQIRQVITIAKSVAPVMIIAEVEGGSAGGHHSWESLDDLLSSTYADVRACDNLVLVAGGGMGTPERASAYISGQWSCAYGLLPMPVDGVMVGSAAMTAKEAHTSPQVKQMLVETPGITNTADDDPFAPLGERWVPSGKVKGGVSSGLSHLHADIYELENASARCGRLLVRVMQHPEELEGRRQEIIGALDSTAKPYFGDLEDMTYLQWAQRFADLSFPWADHTYAIRFFDLLQRIEARVCEQDSGEFESIFSSVHSVENEPQAAIDNMAQTYPQAAELHINPMDIAWFPTLVREYPKPMPFVPVIDNDLLRWWGQDQLWQSEDPRYSADSVRIIPGPLSVGGITTINEPVGHILSRFEHAILERTRELASDEEPRQAFASLAESSSPEEFIRRSPNISWIGHFMENPAFGTALSDPYYEIKPVDTGESPVSTDDATAPGRQRFDLDIHLDTFWDKDADGGLDKHAVRDIVIPLIVDGMQPGCFPVVDRERLPQHVYAMLADTAGIGNTSINGDKLKALPTIEQAKDKTTYPFGLARSGYTLSHNLGIDHEAATAGDLPGDLKVSRIVPDALVGPAWPATYAALGSVYVHGYPVIEGLLNAVHLDHLIELDVSQQTLLGHAGEHINLTSWADEYRESASGRIVTIHVVHTSADGQTLAHGTERFAIRGRSYSDQLPLEAPDYGDFLALHKAAGHKRTLLDTSRRLLRKVTVTAPKEMTAFARTSGDFNPIHTSTRGAAVSGLKAPLVHGMWLSASAQHVVEALDDKGGHYEIAGWTYNMYGMVQLGDKVEISVERVGKISHAGMALEVICRIGGQIVSRGSALVRAPKTAYVYPGQGIQQQGMVLDERAMSSAVQDTWKRADALTRSKLGFSILAVVRDNPKTLVAHGVTYHHPEGLLNLTQFTQAALATVAFAQTARLQEAGMDIWPAYFAGHSLGEYNALSSFAGIIPLETVLELVFHRGTTMHHLIDRDDQGRSNYRLGALRPNQFGVGNDEVNDYVATLSKSSGEFLEIVNYNLSGAQYVIAGTIRGLKVLQEDAAGRAKEYGGKAPFMLVPGIDVPFHSTLLRKGVPEFRDTLDRLLPEHINYRRLVGRYIPNLVAAPFELTKEFAAKILEVAPSERIEAALNDQKIWKQFAADEQKLGRLLLTELLSWQFASPVRWIETQALLFGIKRQGGLGVEEYVEVGLGNAPTLANLAAKTLKLPEFTERRLNVYNVGRDQMRVYMTDTDSLVPQEESEALAETPADDQGAYASSVGSGDTASEKSSESQHQQSAASTAPTVAAEPVEVLANGAGGGPNEDIPYQASDAIMTLLAYSAKVRPDQIGQGDTTDSLTNGVSSRRNQLLMDISSELGVASVDGAAEAAIPDLTALVDKVSPNYRAFGSALSDIVRDRIRGLFGASGIKLAHIEKRVTDFWGLGSGWASHVISSLVLNTREGTSARGDDLASLRSQPAGNINEANALIDAAVQQVAKEHGQSVSTPSVGGTAAGGAVVDSAALAAFAQKVTGSEGIFASTARFVLNELGLNDSGNQGESDSDSRVVAAVEAELGSDWIEQVQPKFDANKTMLFDDRWASAREDLARMYYNGDQRVASLSFIGAGQEVARQAQWFANKAIEDGRQELAPIYDRIALEAAEKPREDPSASRFSGDIAVVTGLAPNSIAAQVVNGLLAGGATVVATSHSFKDSMRTWAKQAYRQHGVGNAKLWLVPANLSCYRDVDALVSWVGHMQKKVSGATTTILKPAYEPTLFFPFAAPPVHGTLADAGQLFESQARLMLWGVERAIAGFSAIGADTDVEHKLHVILPGSPNRGIFGGDGAYGEVKSAFDALVTRSRVERNWSDRVTFAHPRIGWVRGTGLMGANDPLVDVVERHGIQTYSTQQIATKLLDLATPLARQEAQREPVEVDLTGGLGDERLDINALRAEALNDSQHQPQQESSDSSGQQQPNERQGGEARKGDLIKALTTPRIRRQAPVDLEDWKHVSASPEDMIVIVSIGELGPWGSGRTRFDAELGIKPDGSVGLSAGAVLELAWNMGLVVWQDSPKPGWYDSDGNLVPETDIAQRYHDEVVARSGLRPFEDGMGNDYHNGTDEEEVEVYLDHDVQFSVPSLDLAEEYSKLDPEHTAISKDQESGEWTVTRQPGSMIRVPKRAAMTRTVGGQFPKGFDLLKWGIPASMIGDVDQIALWNIVTTVDAYLSVGFSPVEVLQAIHPSMVASTQGTGFGGMSSMRKLYLDRFLNHEIPADILQEALPNVVAAHVMQSYIGGYGNMIQPVSACATAAVSLEEGADKIALGKADFVVTGAIDDIGVESVIGFGDMNATADSQEMYDKGINPRFFSRANDRRRGGFLESQGGGTILLTRGDIALKMGLPVAGLVGFIHSYADGAHTSIPAPGLGALAAGQGGKDSKLVRDLAKLGVSPDDITVVSKHDTSTNANDPNESELHNTLAHAMGRSEGNPLFVISQKTLTGHAKGGACVFQINGLTQLFNSGLVPANVALDCVDPQLRRDDYMVWLTQPLHVGKVKAGLVTSLGFGHVSGFAAIVNPGAFEAAVDHSVGHEALLAWRQQANKRLAKGQRRFEEGMMGQSPLYEPIDNRRFHKDSGKYDAHEVEKAMLLNPDARLGKDGYFE